MDDLVAFLLAREAERERWAKAAAKDVGADWNPGDEFSETVTLAKYGSYILCAPYDGALSTEVREHTAGHDPAFVLADVAAKRQIIDEYERCGPTTVGHIGLRAAVQILALPYADHPDYREEWRRLTSTADRTTLASMGKAICPTCNGKGSVTKEKLRTDKDGKPRTEKTGEVCPQCNWTGWVDR